MKKTCLLLGIILTALLPALSSAASQTADEPLAAVLVIDTSGSMNRSDPDGTSREAGCLFLDMLDRAGSKAAVILFSDRIIQNTDLLELGEGQNAGDLKKELRSAEILGDTDIGSAMQCAVEKLSGIDSSYKKMVVLFTDGKTDLPASPDPIAAAEESENKLDAAAQQAKENGIGVSCVRLYDPKQEEEDFGKLESIAEMTGGGFYAASGRDQIPGIFTGIFAGLVDSETKPVTDLQIGEEGKASFDVTIPSDRVLSADIIMLTSDGVGSVTVEGPDGEIKDPDDQRIRMIREDSYSLIRLMTPETGVWHFTADGPAGCEVHVRLLVESELVLDALVLEDDEGNAGIRAWLSRGEELLDADRMEEFSFTAHIKDTSGKNGGGEKDLAMSFEDGEFGLTVPCRPGGAMEIEVTAQSAGISRTSQKVSFTSSRSDDIIVNEFHGTLKAEGFWANSEKAAVLLNEYFQAWDGSALTFEVSADPERYEKMASLSQANGPGEVIVTNSNNAEFMLIVSAADTYGHVSSIRIPVRCKVGVYRLVRKIPAAAISAAALFALLFIYLRKRPLKGRLSLTVAGDGADTEASVAAVLDGAGRRSSFMKLFPALSETICDLKKVSVSPLSDGIRVKSGGGALLYDCYGDPRTALKLQGGDTFEIICRSGPGQGRRIQLSGVYDSSGERKDEDG